jgi:hypothetical protein
MRAWIKVYGAVSDSALAGIIDSSGNAVTPTGAGTIFNQSIPGPQKAVWVGVQTAPNGDNSYVMLVALIQVLRLNLNESPFWANSGIPALQSVMQQTFPDYHTALIQQQYAPYFSSLLITRTASFPPTYSVNVVLLSGATLSFVVSPTTSAVR